MKAALERLYAQHSAALGQALRWRFGDGPPDPDDAIQIAFEKYIELGAAARVERPRAFLFAMARNWMIDELRKMAVRQRHAERQKTNPLLVRVEDKLDNLDSRITGIEEVLVDIRDKMFADKASRSKQMMTIGMAIIGALVSAVAFLTYQLIINS